MCGSAVRVKPGKGAGRPGGTVERHPSWPLADWDRLPCGDDTEPASQAEEELGEGWWCAHAQRLDHVLDRHRIASRWEGLVLSSPITAFL